MAAERALGPWACAATQPGLLNGPADLDTADLQWFEATVPGTAGAALAAAGSGIGDRDLDAEDWWFRCQVDPPAWDGESVVRFGGLATIADVWLDESHLLHSENMFLPQEIELSAAALAVGGVLVVRCAALRGVADGRRPRPRWKTRLVADQSVRWHRTTLVGRIPGWSPGPAPVGLWRPVTIAPAGRLRLLGRSVRAECVGDDGVVRLQARLRADPEGIGDVVLRVGSATAPLDVRPDANAAGVVVTTGEVVVPAVQRWWPHTHGDQPTYPVSLEVSGTTIGLGRVGFRDLRVNRADGGFQLVVNDVPVFARGACWMPLDPVGLQASREELRATLLSLRDAGLNLVRVTGVGTYEGAEFWDLCDEIGLLVWQDVMLANLDPPADESFTAAVLKELDVVSQEWQGRPSLAVLCGGSEIQQQATYFGLPAGRRELPLVERDVAERLDALLPGVPYLPSTPTGGALPTRLRDGVAHYFGVGAYLRPLTDVRLAGVRFAGECLAFATPPEPETVRDRFGDDGSAVVDAAWRAGTPRDSGTDWDFEDVRDHYVREVYAEDPGRLRRENPARYLDLGRGAVGEAMAAVFSEWRRPGSRCAGGVVLSVRDLVAGPGWGLLDSAGRPKAPWWVLRRILAPVAVLVTDEGLDGIGVHVLNDGGSSLAATLHVERTASEGNPVDSGSRDLLVPARGGLTLDVEDLFDGFRDLNGAHHFGPPIQGCLTVGLVDPAGETLARAVHPLPGPGHVTPTDVGLSATAARGPDGWTVTVTTERYAEGVALDVPGYLPEDSWFNLAGGGSRTVGLRATGGDRRPAGTVRALNARTPAALRVED